MAVDRETGAPTGRAGLTHSGDKQALHPGGTAGRRAWRKESSSPASFGSEGRSLFADCLLNSAPEWQERSLGWQSREMLLACPFERLLRSVAVEANV